LNFIDDLDHAVNPGHNLLGDLLFMEAEQPASEKKNAVFTPARNPSHGFVGTLSQTFQRHFSNGGCIDGLDLVQSVTSGHRKPHAGMDYLTANFLTPWIATFQHHE